ncbi:PDDEXK nuclease domain-containing protein [Flavobacterium sp. J372]|uniref:PDDEXK nuclease domain-containing protein n=1 Tax=Flavobacterium sp. J372 TaxID=2898436 RepID=UPI0021519F56|nr:PDDEXK nuclease domain-containing protein [Flavobacterium sp. J372]MCR5862553.1 PDDEXK nuclease domain-containing protein [Flavobacterium sp. J372]MDC7218185.1 PDDEXK nuclease domain-containing protein [Spirochaetales bacterium]
MIQQQFEEVAGLIKAARSNALKAINREMIDLYWNIGRYISERIESAEWGQSVVEDLAGWLQSKQPELKGFSGSNLWRMRQFYTAYRDFPILAPLVREISWTHNLAIFSRCKAPEEREFYIRLSKEERYSKRELERQISAGLFERTMLGNAKLAPVVREFHPEVANAFRDSYIFDFLNLQEPYDESDLQQGLVSQMRNFILELGKDFLFFGEQYKLQVGSSDFYIDLLFYHRSLQCLVAFELKADKFRPEHIGQLNFYLEALDRDVKKAHENPSIGILLCKDKDNEVVEYSLSRSLSPTMVAEYRTRLPDKRMLRDKLHDIFSQIDEGDKNEKK